MRFYIVCAVLISGLFTGQYALAQYRYQPPVKHIKFETTFHDFGQQQQETKVKHTFHFTNTGEDTMQIADIKTTCGCTAADYPKGPIPPGGEGDVVVQFDTGQKVGRQAKGVNIFWRSGEESNIVIECEVLTP